MDPLAKLKYYINLMYVEAKEDYKTIAIENYEDENFYCGECEHGIFMYDFCFKFYNFRDFPQKLYDYLVTTYGNDFNCSLINMMTDGYEFSMSFGKLTIVFPRNSTYDDWNNITYSSFVKKRTKDTQ